MTVNRFCPRCGHTLVKKKLEERCRDFCECCQAAHYQNPIPASAAVVEDDLGRILLVKRGKEPKVGEWCLPGGYIELDEEPALSCQRELLEETGLHGEYPQLIGLYLSESPIYHSVLVAAYHLRVANYSGLMAGDDSTESRFFALEEMPPLAFRSHRQAVDAYLQRSNGLSRQIGAPWGAYLITASNPVEQVELAVQAGVKIVQYRDKISDRATLYQTAQKLRDLTKRGGTCFVINDHVDLAMAVAADGVHIGQDDWPIEAVRRLVPRQMLIGLSTHSLAQALVAERRGADYIGCGPLFATPTKSHYQPVGLELLRQVLAQVKIPVVAIGGIDLHNLAQVAAAGAQNVAMVRAFAGDPQAVVRAVNKSLLSP